MSQRQSWLACVALAIVIFISVKSNYLMANEYWIDVRTAEEYSAGHIEGATHIPYEDIAKRIHEITEDKDAVIHLYCRSGRRSGVAQEMLQAEGFTKVNNAGGYEDLVRAQQ
ncbi:MAG: rhodanese-like domain-containing protein [Cellvibrio sp.]